MANPKWLVVAPKIQPRVAFLSDIHFQFCDQPAVRAALKYLSDWRPTQIVLGGDIIDCYSISDFDKNPGRSDVLQDELDAAQPFWKDIQGITKNVVYMIGNHEERLNRLISHNPGLFKLRALEFRNAAQLPKNWTVYPSQTHYKMSGLVMMHGDMKGRGSGVKHAAAGMLGKMRTSCLFGHLHRFGTFYESGYDGTVRAGFANGHLSDVEIAADYIAVPDWQTGFTTVEFKGDCFAVRQHLVVGNQFVADGKLYTG